MQDNTAVSEKADRILQTLDSIEYIGIDPQFITGLVRLFENPHTDITELARFMSREPGSCVQMLRLANSAFFSRGEEIKTVQQAIVHLGLSVVKKLAIAFEMIDLFRDTNSFFPYSERNFLKGSIGGALIAEELGRRLGLTETDELFICGLVRDFGVMVLKQYFPDLLREIIDCNAGRQCGFRQACRSVCGFDHRYISFMLFTKWNLPANITAVFQDRSGAQGFRVLFSKIVTQADWILKDFNYGQWDAFSGQQESVSDLFSFYDEEFKSVVKHQLITEADEFIMALGF